MTRPNLRLLVFPVEDHVLREDVGAAIDRLPDGLSDDLARATAQGDLRTWYRSLEIRERDPLGGYAEDPAHVWYVFRDGRVRNPNPSLERLYLAMASARKTYRSSEVAIAAAWDAARSAGYSRPAAPAEAPPGSWLTGRFRRVRAASSTVCARSSARSPAAIFVAVAWLAEVSSA
jgi:hypothetical protein